MSGIITGGSPMFLPEYCVKCGRDAAHGRRTLGARYYYPPWIFLGLIAGLIPLIILSYVGRKQLQISYSLCPECARRQKNKKWIAIAAWVVLAVVVYASLVLVNVALLILAGFLFVLAWVVSYLANQPLTIAGYNSKTQVFTVKGAGERFFAVVDRPAS